MALSDTEIRQTLIMGLESVIEEVKNHELPLSQSGYQVFGKDGDFGDKIAGDQRFWIAAVAITGSRSDVQHIRDILAPPDHAKQNGF